MADQKQDKFIADALKEAQKHLKPAMAGIAPLMETLNKLKNHSSLTPDQKKDAQDKIDEINSKLNGAMNDFKKAKGNAAGK